MLPLFCTNYCTHQQSSAKVNYTANQGRNQNFAKGGVLKLKKICDVI